MSGKQDKKSRRLTADLDKKMAGYIKKLDEDRSVDEAAAIGRYHQYLRKMSFINRFKYAFSLLFPWTNH